MIASYTFVIYIEPLIDGKAALQLTLPSGRQAASSLTLPFPPESVQFILRALNVRQFPDYPMRDYLVRKGEDRHDLIETLKALDLWDGTIPPQGAVALNVHHRVGRLLGRTLLADAPMREGLAELYEAAGDQSTGEIVFQFHPDAVVLAAIPWELAHNESQPLLLTKGAVLGFTRVIRFEHAARQPPPVKGRLRVLTVAPRAQMTEAGRAFEELARAKMRDALDGMVDIEQLPVATIEALQRRLADGPQVDVLDYYGHGTVVDGVGALIMEDSQGGSDAVTANRLQALSNLPPFIVLHACQSAQLNGEEPVASIATALSSSGARAVLAMQLTARMTAQTNSVVPILYQEIAKGQSVQRAVAAVRQSLYIKEADGASWYQPALYLRQHDLHPYFLINRAAPPANPFVGPGALQDPTRFVGRGSELRHFWNRVKLGGNISIVGPSGCGRSALLTLIGKEANEMMGAEVKVLRLSVQRRMKLIESKLLLARQLKGASAKVTDLEILLDGQTILLLLDDLGELSPKGEKQLEVRLWLRSLSQNRLSWKVQLVATSVRPLYETFIYDNSPDYSSLHGVMNDIIKLGAFTEDDARDYLKKGLENTPFQVEDFKDVLIKSLLPRDLQNACRDHYDRLCKC